VGICLADGGTSAAKGTTDPLATQSDDPRHSIAEMCADWLREASVLVAVFAWLDKRVRGEAFSGTWAVEAVGAALFLFSSASWWNGSVRRARLISWNSICRTSLDSVP
jgi:hypothetical protein